MNVAPRGRGLYLWIAAAVVALDQLTKVLVERFMTLHESWTVVEGLARLTYVQNRGAAFGVLSDADLPYQSLLFSGVSLAALLAIGAYAWRLPVHTVLPQTALALVMGGALGNLLDRGRLGYVIDFVDVYWGRYHWPAFNVADASISLGVCLLIVDILRSPQADESGARALAQEPAKSGMAAEPQ